MNLYLDIASSIEFWRQRYPGHRAPEQPPALTHDECAFRKRDVETLMPAWVNHEFLVPTKGVLHVLAFDHAQRRQLESISVHSWVGPLPKGAFYELQPHVFIESPEFMFLHAARVLNLVQLIAFGDELCGLYCFDRRQKRGFSKRKYSVTTKAKIGRLLQKVSNCHGKGLALKALQYVIERIARIMGRSLRKNQLGATPQRLELRRTLYSWNHSNGAIR